MWVNTPEGRVEYGHDPQGRLTQVKTSTGIDTVYTYTSRGQIKTISDRGLSSASDATGTVSYGYDEFGRKESITRPNGTTSEYTYDPLTGWTESITHKRGATVLLALGYDRDKTGLITDIAETRPAGEQSGAWHYGYDTLKRLSGATWTPSAGAATAYGYTYDRNGNRLSESVSGSATKYSRYNKLDQLLDERTSAAYPGGTIEKSYAWDKHGRLSSESGVGVSPAIDRLYTWSVDDRLESVQLGANPTDPTVRYTYDHEGRLIKREKGQDVARFLVDNNNPTGYSQALAEVNADATKPTENYYYGDDFGPLAQVHNPGAAGFDQRFLYGDHLSTTRLLDSALASDSYHYYTPFGNQTGPSTPLSAFSFTGQYRDIDSGLQYHRARWLNTGAGRWLSEDPVFDWPGNFGNGFGYVSIGGPGAYDISGSQGEVLEMPMVLNMSMNLASISLPAWAVVGAGALVAAALGLLVATIAHNVLQNYHAAASVGSAALASGVAAALALPAGITIGKADVDLRLDSVRKFFQDLIEATLNELKQVGKELLKRAPYMFVHFTTPERCAMILAEGVLATGIRGFVYLAPLAYVLLKQAAIVAKIMPGDTRWDRDKRSVTNTFIVLNMKAYVERKAWIPVPYPVPGSEDGFEFRVPFDIDLKVVDSGKIPVFICAGPCLL